MKRQQKPGIGKAEDKKSRVTDQPGHETIVDSDEPFLRSKWTISAHPSSPSFKPLEGPLSCSAVVRCRYGLQLRCRALGCSASLLGQTHSSRVLVDKAYRI
ncbi:hypothetical protein AFLA_000967 [Aspergillus flavus NRRL3357]|nr:hypothetical protein AFLA_000967 [Aspergillus flavus NRRL3357]